MTEPDIEFRSRAPRHPPQLTVTLDESAHVLDVNRGRAGVSFDHVVENSGLTLHEQMHPGCSGDCRFNELWKRGWATLASRDSVEWEIDDRQFGGWLRLSLSRPPTPRDVKIERRRRYALLTITDLSRIRQEYEALQGRYQSLLQVVREGSAAAGGRRPDDDEADHAEQIADEEPNVLNRVMATRVTRAREDECRRIASDLHDGIAQMLSVVKFGIEGRLASLRRRYPDDDQADFEDILDQVKAAIGDLRRISGNLAPAVLDDFGVSVAVETLCREFQAEHPGLTIDFSARVDEIVVPEICKIAIYRVTQEALNNVAKHAGADRVSVAIDSDGGDLRLTISDNGRGFEPPARKAAGLPRGFGLRSMRGRVATTGGQLEIRSREGDGTIIQASWRPDVLRLLVD